MKVLISTDFGAGWSSWAHPQEVARFILTYQPIIDAIESGHRITDLGEWEGKGDDHHFVGGDPLLVQLLADVKSRFNRTYVCFLGACSLEVRNVHGRFRVTEYDGAEDIDQPDGPEWMDAL